MIFLEPEKSNKAKTQQGQCNKNAKLQTCYESVMIRIMVTFSDVNEKNLQLKSDKNVL